MAQMNIILGMGLWYCASMEPANFRPGKKMRPLFLVDQIESRPAHVRREVSPKHIAIAAAAANLLQENARPALR